MTLAPRSHALVFGLALLPFGALPVAGQAVPHCEERVRGDYASHVLTAWIEASAWSRAEIAISVPGGELDEKAVDAILVGSYAILVASRSDLDDPQSLTDESEEAVALADAAYNTFGSQRGAGRGLINEVRRLGRVRAESFAQQTEFYRMMARELCGLSVVEVDLLLPDPFASLLGGAG
ncbi:hypothetical protein WI372_11610 [Gemmatimonadota bacterium DH-20]|uniref:Uncharacterized protein n=1 Tax=Gaopeijia maritima TaxID=3119007 RepID=A0ABU9EA75_9BACT